MITRDNIKENEKNENTNNKKTFFSAKYEN